MTTDLVEKLLAGPRGRRLLLEYALESELSKDSVRRPGTFGHAVVHAASNFRPRSREVGRGLSWEASVEAAQRLNAVELLKPTPGFLRNMLAMAVDHARYWQEPDGEDLLAATPEMKSSLQRVAKLVAAAPASAWWVTSVAIQTQHSVQWDDSEPRQPLSKERRAHISADESGGWWSRPPHVVPASARLLFDDSPAGLWFVEDNLGWTHAESVSLTAPDGVQVLEITCAADWAQLCGRFPRDVTTQMRDVWHRATSHTARWFIPDWYQVAQHYDAVHLQVGAYLSAAGTPIPIDVSPDAASLIAGWSPDESYWFTPHITYGGDRIHWKLEEHGADMLWLPEP